MKLTKEIDKDGNIFYKNKLGQYHRLDGPAIEWSNGTKYWYLNGKLHRVDGPAREWANGSKFWYLYGEEYSEQEFNDFFLKKRLQRILEL